MTTLQDPRLVAFHGREAVKGRYLTRVLEHRKADEIIQGYDYWRDGKGCAIGCTLHSANHMAYESELGIPVILARLEDRIFENLPVKLARAWPEKFLSAPRVGVDLSMVWPRFAHWLLADQNAGAIKFAKTDRTRQAIRDAAPLFARWIAGNKPSLEEWHLARKNAAAYAATAAAAYASAAAYAYASDAYAAATTAYTVNDASSDAAAAYAYAAAACTAHDAANDAAYAHAADLARQKFFTLMSEKLLELMKASPLATE